MLLAIVGDDTSRAGLEEWEAAQWVREYQLLSLGDDARLANNNDCIVTRFVTRRWPSYKSRSAG